MLESLTYVARRVCGCTESRKGDQESEAVSMRFQAPGLRQDRYEQIPASSTGPGLLGSSTTPPTATPGKTRRLHLPHHANLGGRARSVIGSRVARLFDMAVLPSFFVLLLLWAPGLDYFLTSQDHGFQLSVGTQVALGKVPGIDIVIGYGPATMYTSALGLWLSGSLLGEVILCAGGYAVALYLTYRLVRESASRPVALAASGLEFSLLARFYKWYVWLIPLASLWALHRYVASQPDRRRRWACVCGVVLGVCWLYRPDMGTMQLIVGTVVVALAEIRWAAPSPGAKIELGIVRAAKHELLLAGTFSAPILLWLGYLVFRAGPAAPLHYFATTLAGALAVAKGMAQQVPANDAVVRAYFLAPLVLIVAVAAGLFCEFSGRSSARSQFLLTAALVGLASAHQAMHRKGPGHLLQVLPAIVVCGFVSFAGFRDWAANASLRRPATWAVGLTGIAYFSLLFAGAIGLVPWGRQDLVPIPASPTHRFWELAHPRSAALRYPAGGVVGFIRQETSRRDPILIFPLDCQLYAIVERRLSGRLHAYYPGVLDDAQSQEENLSAIRREMPQLVVLPSDRKRHSPNDPNGDIVARSREAHRYLEEFLRARYIRVAYDDGEFMVLAPAEGGRPA